MPSDNHFLRCCLINSRNICNKLPEMNYLLSSNTFHIVLITESCLTDQYSDTLIPSNLDYSVFRRDRLAVAGGGVLAIADNKHCACVPVTIPERFLNTEILCFDVFVQPLNTASLFVTAPPPPQDRMIFLFCI